MKYIEKLLQGVEVEWKKLGEVAEIGTGSSNRQDEVEQGEYPFYVRSKNILRSTTYQFDETAIIIPGEGGIGDIYHYAEGKYALHQRAYRIHLIDDCLLDRFLFHFMEACFKRYIVSKSLVATTTSIRKPMLEQFPIPIPPLHVQQELVRILDKFTELETELELRKQQYERYRDQLLSPDKGLSETKVEWKKLGEVCKIKNGKSYKHLNDGDIPVYGSGGIMRYVDKAAYDRPSVLIPRKGSLKNLFYVETPFWNVDTIFYTEIEVNKILPKYLYYFLATQKLEELNLAGGVPSLTQTMLNVVPIPIPPLSEQQRIVSLLDKFHTLTTSISEGLPREIELRKQQYAYYRDQLLSFER